MTESLDSKLSVDKCSRARFVAISYAADFEKYSGYRKTLGSRTVFPFENMAETVNDIAYTVKQGGNKKAKARLIGMLNEEDEGHMKPKKGKLPVIIALTEISLVLAEEGIFDGPGSPEIAGRVIYDTLRIHGEDLALRWLKG